MCSCHGNMILEDQPQKDRATAHDLRNLFGIVSSAARLLAPSLDREELASIQAALTRASLRGGSICDAMISMMHDPLTLPTDDLDRAIAAVIPLIRPLLPQSISLTTDLKAARAGVPLGGEDIETILVELVGNAVRHGEGASRLVVRSRLAAGRAWLFVADNGRGRLERRRAVHHGHGLLRLDLLVRRAGGDLQLRRAKGGGLVAGISFAIVADPRSGPRKFTQPPEKENDHENRQSVAA